MHYHLSGGQLKSLLVRHTPIKIALPSPEEDQDDFMKWAKSVMDDDVREYLFSAETDVIAVGPGRGAEGLSSVIGEIDPRDRSIVWMVEIIVCHFKPRKSLHPCARLQWPKSVDTASGRWPLEK